MLLSVSLSIYSYSESGKKLFIGQGVLVKFNHREVSGYVIDISKKTNFIVAGDNMGPSKLTKAQDLGLEIISEQDFIDKIS